MQVFLILLIVLAVIATVIALLRGIYYFVKSNEADLRNPVRNLSGERQNKMMQARIMFQALAVILVVLLLLLSRSN
ncbi:MAG TPA: twin transmembrane helix small protein [Sphingomonadaceae bacterium]|nr:twin transmembrane helix small protein [Sphingomonadaceae bacterium]